MTVEKREISGNEFGTPVSVRPTGCLYFVGIFCALMAFGALASGVNELRQANELKKKEIRIQQERLDVAKRQYTLDSLKFYSNGKNR